MLLKTMSIFEVYQAIDKRNGAEGEPEKDEPATTPRNEYSSKNIAGTFVTLP